MEKCLLLSFAFSKIFSGYPPIPYLISSILAKFKYSNYIKLELDIYYMDNYFEYSPLGIETRIINNFKKMYLDKINTYSFIAISAYTWTENLVNGLINILKPIFNGKIILVLCKI